MGYVGAFDVHIRSLEAFGGGAFRETSESKWSSLQLGGGREAHLWMRTCCGSRKVDVWRMRGSSSFGAGVRCPRRHWMQHSTAVDRDDGLVIGEEADGSHSEEERTNINEQERTNIIEQETPVDVPRPQLTVSRFRQGLDTVDFCLQVAIFAFAAGVVDAGFSGDWSRSGYLSREVEGDIQIAALGVVPLAATLIWSISERNKRGCD